MPNNKTNNFRSAIPGNNFHPFLLPFEVTR